MVEEKKKKRSWTEKLRLTLSREETFEEIWNIRITRVGFTAALFSFILGIVMIVSLLIAFTDLRELIPGYPDVTVRENIVRNAILLDSLENEIKLRDLYLSNIQKIVSGEAPDNFTSDADTLTSQEEIRFSRSAEDSLLRQQIESEEEFNLSLTRDYSERQVAFYKLAFFAPVRGIISGHFDPARSHFATDIVGTPGMVVHATLDGTVIMTLRAASSAQGAGYFRMVARQAFAVVWPSMYRGARTAPAIRTGITPDAQSRGTSM